MKFQLPEDKASRNKILFLIGMVSVALLYAIIMFGVIPYLSRMRMGRERLAELNDLLWQAERDIRQAPQQRARNIDVVNEILEISENQRFVLRPSLGNYLLVADAFLQQVAEQSGITLQNIRETSGPPPASAAANPNQLPAFWPYAVSFTASASLHDLLHFIHTLQKENPYIALISLSVTAGRDQQLGQHAINATVQWPVWNDPERPNRLAVELLADEEP